VSGRTDWFAGATCGIFNPEFCPGLPARGLADLAPGKAGDELVQLLLDLEDDRSRTGPQQRREATENLDEMAARDRTMVMASSGITVESRSWSGTQTI
jgi:hypothetical protein